MTIKNEINRAIEKYYHNELIKNIGAYMIIIHKNTEMGYTSTMLCGDNQVELDEDTINLHIMFGIVNIGSGSFLVYSCNEWIPTSAHELNNIFQNHFKEVI